MADITEIIEESAVQLEIVESGGGQIEIIGEDPTMIEVVETTFSSNDLDIATKTNTLAIETPSSNTVVNISVDPSTVIETTTNNNEIIINGFTISPKKNFCIIKIWTGNCKVQNPKIFNIDGFSDVACLFKTHQVQY